MANTLKTIICEQLEVLLLLLLTYIIHHRLLCTPAYCVYSVKRCTDCPNVLNFVGAVNHVILFELKDEWKLSQSSGVVTNEPNRKCESEYTFRQDEVMLQRRVAIG